MPVLNARKWYSHCVSCSFNVVACYSCLVLFSPTVHLSCFSRLLWLINHGGTVFLYTCMEILEIFFVNVFPTCRKLVIMLTLVSCMSKTPLAQVNLENNKQPCWTKRLHSATICWTQKGHPYVYNTIYGIDDWLNRNVKCLGEFLIWSSHINEIGSKINVWYCLIVAQYMLLNPVFCSLHFYLSLHFTPVYSP